MSKIAQGGHDRVEKRLVFPIALQEDARTAHRQEGVVASGVEDGALQRVGDFPGLFMTPEHCCPANDFVVRWNELHFSEK